MKIVINSPNIIYFDKLISNLRRTVEDYSERKLLYATKNIQTFAFDS